MPYKDPIKQKEFQRNNYLNNKEKWTERQKIRRIKNREFVNSFKKNLSCSKCSENNIACLDFHHKNPSNKDSSICQGIRNWGLERIKQEIEKCEILCSNCHRKYHYKEYSVNVIRNLLPQHKINYEFVSNFKKSFPCKCGENDPSCLDFHHLDSKLKGIAVATAIYSRSLNKIKQEIEKCEILCSNCHRRYHRK